MGGEKGTDACRHSQVSDLVSEGLFGARRVMREGGRLDHVPVPAIAKIRTQDALFLRCRPAQESKHKQTCYPRRNQKRRGNEKEVRWWIADVISAVSPSLACCDCDCASVCVCVCL